MSDDLLRTIERLLYREARLLDQRQFRDWLELFTDDVHYWMPTRFNRLRDREGAAERWEIEREIADEGESAFFDETKETLEQRVARLETGMAWAEDPPSRTRHVITNIEVEPTDSSEELRVYSNFVLYRSRLETQEDWFVGGREDLMRRVDGQWRIARRKILYDQAVSNAPNLSIFF